MKNLRNKNGITLLELVITIVVMMILVISITSSISSTLEIKKYYAVKEDIIALTENVQKYYETNGSVPSSETVSFDIDTLNSSDKNPNDNGVYYKIDIDKLLAFDSTIELNNPEDTYLVNEQSLTVYYEDGVKLDGKIHYTVVDDFSGGSFAENYYSNTDLPIISAVTLKSSGQQENRASVGDTVTLKMIANYTLTTEPTVTINGQEVSATWNGKVGTATYDITLDDTAKQNGEKIAIKISDYSADGKDGKEITDVTFGKGVSIYAKTLVELYKEGYLETGDWVNYQNPTTVSADVKATDSNYSDTGYTSSASRTGMSTADGYTEDINQEYSLKNNGVQVNWRILGLSEDGEQLLLTTGSPLQRTWDSSQSKGESNSPYFYLRGAKGCAYDYGIAELNKICAMYTNNLADKVRSLTIDDINRLCNVVVDISNKKVTKASDTLTNIAGGCIGKSQTYENQFESPEAYIADSTDTGKTASFEKMGDEYIYKAKEVIDSSLALYDVLFARTGQTDGDYRYYWLASRVVSVYSTTCCWCPDHVGFDLVGSHDDAFLQLFYSDGYSRDDCLAVRPVIYLKSDVTVDQLQKVDTPTSGEEAWNYS